jgi:hypothetical protein
VFFYVRGVERELGALQARLRIAAMTLAVVDRRPTTSLAIRGPADVESAGYRRLRRAIPRGRRRRARLLAIST